MRHKPDLNEKELKYLKSRVDSDEVIHWTQVIGRKKEEYPEVRLKDYGEIDRTVAFKKKPNYQRLAYWLREKNEEHRSGDE